jgi:hypothetical protein
MLFVAHLKKMRFKSKNIKFKIPLNCRDGTMLPQCGIYKKQSTGTKLNKSISSAHNILPRKRFQQPQLTMNILCITTLHGAAINQLVSYVKNTGSVQELTCAASSL